MSWPAKLTPYIPSQLQPPSETRFDNHVSFTSVERLNDGEWPVWANGQFALDAPHKYFEENKKLQVLWATQTSSYNGGKGSVNSLTAKDGKTSSRKCLGVLKCTRNGCPIVIRPVTGGMAKIQAQLAGKCQCGSQAWIIQWGQLGSDISTRKYRYINGPEHNHSRFPNKLGIGKAQ